MPDQPTRPLRTEGTRIVDGRGEPDPPEGREHRRLAEHGELHHRLRRQRVDDARARCATVLGDDRVRAVLRPAADRVLRRGRRRVPRRLGHELRAHPGQLPPLRGRRPAVRDHRGRLPPPRPGDRRRAARTASTRSSTCTRCPGSQNHHWHSDNPTHRRAVLGAPALPGPRGRILGGDRRPLQGQPLGGGLQPDERARRRVARGRRARSTPAWSTPSARSTRTTSSSSTATRTRPSSTSSASRWTTPSTLCHDYCRAGPRPRRRLPRRHGRQVRRQGGRRRSSSSAPSTPPHRDADLGRRVRADLHRRRAHATRCAGRSSTTSSRSTARDDASWPPGCTRTSGGRA